MRRVARLLCGVLAALLTPAAVADARCHTLSAHQNSVLRAAHAEAHHHDAPYRAQIALISAGWVESRLQDLAGGHADSAGWLQLRVGLWGRARARSVKRSAHAFLLSGFTGRGGAIALARRGWSPGVIAQAVQGSAHPGRYHAASARARRLHRCSQP